MALVHDVIPPFQLFQPATVDEALDLLDARGAEAWVLAGGMDSMDWLKDRTKRTSAVVELGQIGELRGIREEGRLVAVAGTHLMAPSLGVCAIGNVYTRQDSRGRGLAARVTAAVVGHALRHGARTVVLNVRQSNEGARRVYERLGFREYCEFVEGSARRVQPYTLRL